MTSVLSYLFRSIVNSWRRLSGFSARDVGSLGIVIAMLVLVELFGRSHSSEFLDLVAVAAVAGLLGICTGWHNRWRLTWTQWLRSVGAAVVRSVLRLRFELGVDLRERPPIPPGIPPSTVLQLSTASILTLAATAWALWSSVPFRDVAVQGLYLGYLAGFAFLWSALIAVMVFTVTLPNVYVFDLLLTYTRWRRARARTVSLGLTAASVVCLVLLAVSMPAWVPVALLSALIPVGGVILAMPPSRPLICLWKLRSGGPVRSISWLRFCVLEGVSFHLGLVALALLAIGAPSFGRPVAPLTTPILSAVGLVAAWFCCYCLGVFYVLGGTHLGLARLRDPSRPAPTVVHVSGAIDSSLRRRIAGRLNRLGWTARFAPVEPRRTDVRIQVLGSGTSTAAENVTSDPNRRPTFVLFESELDEPEVQEQIARRDVIQRRRIVVRTFRSIFRNAASRRPRRGCGYWIAPQYWFVTGLTRDVSDEVHTQLMDVIPPLYHRALPHAARHHVGEICRALQVDLIFLEDGVGFRGLRRVLRVLFERYDVDGGRQPVQEIHFSGLPKVRVIIHDFTLNKPLVKTKYPEPDYDEVGRARILHVYRDRGDDEPSVPSPEEFDFLLSPVA